jgi:MarR family transcriptional regulator, organic hydroperoxide resistance regulator
MIKDIGIELMDTMFGLFRLMKEEISANNFTHLSILQIQALFFLKQHENIPMGDIADFFHIELSSATSLLNKLYDQKLVERNEDPSDRRLVRITLTTKGKTLLEQAMNDRRKKMEKMLSYLSIKEKTELLNILKTLSSKLQK